MNKTEEKEEKEEFFNVYLFLPNFYKEQVGSHLTAKAAMSLAASYSHPQRPANVLGIIERIQIVSTTDDATVFLWEKDKGITYPQLISSEGEQL
jgi:hypothetical protein